MMRQRRYYIHAGASYLTRAGGRRSEGATWGPRARSIVRIAQRPASSQRQHWHTGICLGAAERLLALRHIMK
jgi:hypothetical protein